MGINIRVHNAERLPTTPYLVIANHRSFLDAPLLIAAAMQPIHFACHHYMSQVPVMKNVVHSLGCFPLDGPKERGRTFLKQANQFLKSNQSIGIFPEGTSPMVKLPPPLSVGEFHRGFAHLALRSPIEDLQIVPAAILALEETQQQTVPFKVLSWFDPSEPLFNQSGRHPAALYRRVAVTFGEPISLSQPLRQSYRGKQAGQVATDLSDRCQQQIQALLTRGCY